ncbi:MAG: TIR domain-containing protein [Albidovulum sp.]|nr:TIR domain-containing protein [Albidovulum sp.]
MYNLFVSANDDAWNGNPWIIDRNRCVKEYTSNAIREAYGALGHAEVDQLKSFPCIFAYESFNKLNPHFGRIHDVTVRINLVRVGYELHRLDMFLSANQLEEMTFELEIENWELSRTHWAVKDVDLHAELNSKGITLPRWAASAGATINLEYHQFDVALSFPGEDRDYVEQVVQHLEQLLGPDRCFYDQNYTAQLARPSLDAFLQAIYRERSLLVVVFAGGNYQLKDWCGIEFKAVREIINLRKDNRVMFVRMDDGEVEGVFPQDGYVDAHQHEPADIATFIKQRVDLLRF